MSLDSGDSSTYQRPKLSTEEYLPPKSPLRLDTAAGQDVTSNKTGSQNEGMNRDVSYEAGAVDSRDAEDTVVMSPTSYPGMEWKPAGLEHEW